MFLCPGLTSCQNKTKTENDEGKVTVSLEKNKKIAEGDWVATRFYRTVDYNGKRIVVEVMHFKRFEDGKIAEIWEYADTGQIETGEE